MVLTNALLSLGFVIVSNFANVVGIPHALTPSAPGDLSKFVVGTFHAPTDLYLVHRGGTEFWIEDGAVWMFQTADSYCHLQDSSLIPALLGTPSVNSNEAVAVATRVLSGLARGTNPVASISPVVKSAGTFEGNPIPVYEVFWPKPYRTPGFGYFAGIEIDARTGRVTSLELHDPAFGDTNMEAKIKRDCYIPSAHDHPILSVEAKPKPPRFFPLPQTNEVLKAIVVWRWLCGKLAIPTPFDTTLQQVDWERTCILTNYSAMSATDRVCRVEFRSGAWLLALPHCPISHHGCASYFTGSGQARSPVEQEAFRGTIKYRWQDLAKKLEKMVAENLGVRSEYLQQYRPVPLFEPAPFGTLAPNKRVLVSWTSEDKYERQGFGAEFDAETGELSDIGFTDPQILECIARTLRAHPE